MPSPDVVEKVKALLPEMRTYFSGLRPFLDEPVSLDNWAAMVDLNYYQFCGCLQSLDSALLRAYRNQIKVRKDNIRAEIKELKNTSHDNLIPLAEKYGATVQSLQAVARRIGKHVVKEQMFSKEKVLAVAKPGMTMCDLATAMGVHLGSLKSARCEGRFDDFLSFKYEDSRSKGKFTRRLVITKVKKK